MDKQQVQELKNRLGTLKSERQQFDVIWEEVAEYMGPAYMGFTSEPFHPRWSRPDLVDSTARRAAKVFSAGMLSGASSPSQRWFTLTLDDPDLAEWAPARAWLQELERVYGDDLLQRGFYPQQHLAFHQAGLFGWQCLYVDESPDMGIRFSSRPLREIYIAENHQGTVDTVFREFTLTARQAAQKWGKANLPRELQEELNRPRGNRERRHTFSHAVYPRRDADTARLDAKGKRFASIYYSPEHEHKIGEGGYDEMPYIVTRSYRLPGTPYSYSPGTEALADAKMINEMKRLILEAGQLSVAPPYLMPDDGFIGDMSFEPRALNYYRADGQRGPNDFSPLNVGGDPRFAWELLQGTKQDINEAFFVDLFLAIRQRSEAKGDPTAFEVSQLDSERMFQLGPVLIQQQNENFAALFERLFALKLRRGELPPLDRSLARALAGRSVKAEYVSPLALAQRQFRTRAILSAYQQVAMVAQVGGPQVLENFDHDANAREIMEQSGMPQKGIRPEEDVARGRQAQAQAAAAAQQTAGMAAMADKYPALAKAPEKGSPAARLLESAGQGQEG